MKIYNLLFHKLFPFFLPLTFHRFLAFSLVDLGLGDCAVAVSHWFSVFWPIGLRSLTTVMRSSVQTILNVSSTQTQSTDR